MDEANKMRVVLCGTCPKCKEKTVFLETSRRATILFRVSFDGKGTEYFDMKEYDNDEEQDGEFYCPHCGMEVDPSDVFVELR